jgi:DNA-binding transcriptional LysR family regulator
MLRADSPWTSPAASTARLAEPLTTRVDDLPDWRHPATVRRAVAVLDDVDALAALHRFGTISEAATWLRCTQSGMSKKLRAIQESVTFTVLEREGRRVRLTPQAVDFLARARPLIAELRALGRRREPAAADRLSLVMSESLAASWGPEIVRVASVRAACPTVEIEVDREPLALESVRLGRIDLALCASPIDAGDLASEPIFDEPMILLHSTLGPQPDPTVPSCSSRRGPRPGNPPRRPFIPVSRVTFAARSSTSRPSR